MQEDEYDPTVCPAAGCDYEDAIRSVAAHVSRTDDDRHSWDDLAFEGARDFVMREKRRQRDGESETSGSDSVAPSADESPDADESVELDLGFARDALLLLDTVRRYDVDSLDELDASRLVNLYTLLSDVNRGADDARKRVRDVLTEVVPDDREVSSDFGSVRRYTARRRNRKDDDVVRAELERAGIDPREAMSFDDGKIRRFVEERGLDESAVFDREERAYVQKASEDDGGRRRAFDDLDPEIRALLDDR
ncbi:hypothetical protein [Haladaptatus salinisoli]|uniref:hypothetical protein n=1 Tax=Haladaptatus salinisoli TaxID=2884876 RepID=UPI001D0BB21C|nr:hypothetical protein [Haladaptatus salinisoli]